MCRTSEDNTLYIPYCSLFYGINTMDCFLSTLWWTGAIYSIMQLVEYLHNHGTKSLTISCVVHNWRFKIVIFDRIVSCINSRHVLFYNLRYDCIVDHIFSQQQHYTQEQIMVKPYNSIINTMQRSSGSLIPGTDTRYGRKKEQ